jgi:isopentenyldiphosphate isomerase
MPEKLLNIVDENDNVIGEEERKVIHEKGLLHREVHVWFVTPDNQIIFQHRAKNKDTFPNLLDISVGGHVEIGDSYIETVIKEVDEETGVKIKQSDLIFIDKIRRDSKDEITKMSNNTF